MSKSSLRFSLSCLLAAAAVAAAIPALAQSAGETEEIVVTESKLRQPIGPVIPPLPSRPSDFGAQEERPWICGTPWVEDAHRRLPLRFYVHRDSPKPGGSGRVRRAELDVTNTCGGMNPPRDGVCGPRHRDRR